MTRNKTDILLAALLALVLTACGNSRKDHGTEAVQDSESLVQQVRECSRLYTTEYRVHKIVACETNRQVEGFGMTLGLDLFGDRKMVIPIDATVKGYIDFSHFSEDNVRRDGNLLTITLPDPQAMLVSTRVDQEGIKEYVTGFRHPFSDQEMAQFEAQGREAIIADIPRLGIEKRAREDAVRLLVPLLRALGFAEESIVIDFRQDYHPQELIRTLD